jgi:hypothetical protein
MSPLPTRTQRNNGQAGPGADRKAVGVQMWGKGGAVHRREEGGKEMDSIGEALEMMFRKFKEEFGDDAQLEEGDEIVAVFNDAVIEISMNPGMDLKVNVMAGKPYIFDFDLNLLIGSNSQDGDRHA